MLVLKFILVDKEAETVCVCVCVKHQHLKKINHFFAQTCLYVFFKYTNISNKNNDSSCYFFVNCLCRINEVHSKSFRTILYIF